MSNAALAFAEELTPVAPPKVDRYGIVTAPPKHVDLTHEIPALAVVAPDGVAFDNYEATPRVVNDIHNLIERTNVHALDQTVVINNTGAWAIDNSIIATNDTNLVYNATGAVALTAATHNVELYNTGVNEITITVNGQPFPIIIPAGQCVVVDTAGTFNNYGNTWNHGTTTTGNLTFPSYKYEESKRDKFLREIRSKMSAHVGGRQKPLRRAIPGPELKARQTLREMILESEWRRYMTNGFIMTRGQSGKWYQIFNDMRRIQVYEQNRLICRLCVYTVKDCPPTDHVINMKLLAELDEANLWASSNVYNVVPGTEYGQNNPNRQNRTPQNIVVADTGQLVVANANVIINGLNVYQVDANGTFASVA
jgi:hypothetical protein